MNDMVDTESDLRDEVFVGADEGEPVGPHDFSDDAEALASAGMGTDEDYGGEDRCLDSYYESQTECDF